MYTFFRKYARKLLLDLLSIKSTPKPGIHILNGHFLSVKDNTTGKVFSNQLKMLFDRGVGFINFDTAVECVEKRKIPADKCLVAFTFDDGFEECFTKIRPVLHEFGIKAGFFINPNFIDGSPAYQQNFKEKVVLTNKPPMNWEQISTLRDEGHSIGAHTMDHLKLAIQDRNILEYQIGKSKEYIQNKLNSPCEYFAFPFGKLKHISDMGIEIAKKYFTYVFSQDNYTNYYSFGGKVINRRHFECDWPYKHVIYFLKEKSMKI